MAPVFGTDGLRGIANRDLTASLVLSLGRAAARHIDVPVLLLGRDTRRSGPMLAAALAAGFAAEGVDVVDVGVIPTPGIAYLAQLHDAAGAVVSASHNPFEDNGIKLLLAGGSKLPASTERAIEAELALIAHAPADEGGSGHAVGRIDLELDRLDAYIDHLVTAGAPSTGRPMRILVDCANGAASQVAPLVLRALGHEVVVCFAEPDGVNINAGCGSTDPAAAARAVVDEHADLGLCFDGDADRLVAIDERGHVVDGDSLIALFALHLDASGALPGRGTVVTVLSNLGLRRALEQRGMTVIETAVGDRAVVEAMEHGGYLLGGEQSGHIVFRDRATTGDGVLTALQLLNVLAGTGANRLSTLVDGLVVRVPQEMVTLRVPDRAAVASAPALLHAVDDAERELGSSGRILVRASGTEQAVRIMVESDDAATAHDIVVRLSEIVRTLGADATR